MAVWQYQLQVLPRENIIKEFNTIPIKLFINHRGWEKFWKTFTGNFNHIKYGFKDARTIDWWHQKPINIEELVNQIDKLVKRSNWCNDINLINWKGDADLNEDNDCFIAFNAKKIKEFQFRIDLRDGKNIDQFLIGMLDICKENNCLLMNTRGNLFEPEIEIIIKDIKQSNAFEFVIDPIKYFDKNSDKEV